MSEHPSGSLVHLQERALGLTHSDRSTWGSRCGGGTCASPCRAPAPGTAARRLPPRSAPRPSRRRMPACTPPQAQPAPAGTNTQPIIMQRCCRLGIASWAESSFHPQLQTTVSSTWASRTECDSYCNPREDTSAILSLIRRHWGIQGRGVYLVDEEHHELAAQDDALQRPLPAGCSLLLAQAEVVAAVVLGVPRCPPHHREAVVVAVPQHPGHVRHALNRPECPTPQQARLSLLSEDPRQARVSVMCLDRMRASRLCHGFTSDEHTQLSSRAL